LWGGIIGEDGLPGIKLGKTHPGSAYYEFQQEILNLFNRGIILAVCSKNESEDVLQVFRNHPDMLLKEKHIAAFKVNWEDKPANLRRIAQELNIGLDSLVFVDDSQFEADLVRTALPEVEVIHLPENRAVEYKYILASCGLFDTLALSEEDKNRGAMYKAEAARKELLSTTTDMKTYLSSLEMQLEIRFPDTFSTPRVAQLTQKTNQFNLTTRRYSESNIREFLEASNSDVILLKVRDKFGDYGIVGACILRYDEVTALIDSFLLSCRVIGRGVEEAFLAEALKLAAQKNCQIVVGEYYASAKNAQVKDFYVKQGFQRITAGNQECDERYEYNLKNAHRLTGSFKNIESDVR
jgi:FkbH-like protein